MSEREISSAFIGAVEAMPQHREKYGTTAEQARARLRDVARAAMQLWNDLEQEERAGRKALA